MEFAPEIYAGRPGEICMKLLHAAILTGILTGITLSSVIILSLVSGVGFNLGWILAVFLANVGLAFLISSNSMFRGRRDVGALGAFSAVTATVAYLIVAGQFWPAGYDWDVSWIVWALRGAECGILFGGLPGLIGAVLSRHVKLRFPAILDRKETSGTADATKVIAASVFEVSVNVPSVGKTVKLEVASDHSVGELMETLISTLNLARSRAYALGHAKQLISKTDFGKTLGTLGIKEGSKLSLRVIE